jgi:hypothetical protein
MKARARAPAGVPAATSARSRSPTEMCTSPYLSTMRAHWVPLPAAGAPAIMTRSGAAAPPAAACGAEEGEGRG